MDGSIVIGVSLDSSAFETALQRLRQTAGQTAVRALEPLTRSMQTLESAFYSGSTGAQQWAARVLSAFRTTRTGAAAVVPQLQSTGRQAGQSFITGVLQGDFSGAGAAAGQRLLQGMQSVDCYGAGLQAANSLYRGLSAGGVSLASLGTSLANRVKGAFSGDWYNVGYYISAGIAAGIRGGSSLITSAATLAARQALASAKQTLGVRSPSRVFRDQVGRMIPAGIAQGVRQGGPEVEEAMKRQSQRLVEVARQDVRPTLGLQDGGQSAPVQVQSPIRVTLEAPLVVDGRELARATARYTGQQLLWESF